MSTLLVASVPFGSCNAELSRDGLSFRDDVSAAEQTVGEKS